MAKFMLKKVESCQACEGKGMVPHIAWIEYWKDNAKKQPMTLDQDRDWFREHGWEFLISQGHGIPEEECCAECEGNGQIITECDLLDAIPELYTALKSYGTW